jgi:hypothetical protein
MPAVLGMLGEARGIDAWLFLAAGFDALAPELIEMFDTLRSSVEVPVLLTWQSMPEGTLEALAVGAHVPYRSAALTKLLYPSLSGGSVTWMLATVSPEDIDAYETTQTLKCVKTSLIAFL